MSKIYLFTADWCSACKNLKGELDRIEGGVEPEIVDADSAEGGELIKRYGVRGLPTLLKVDKNDEVIGALVGYQYSREKFEQFLEV